MVNQSYNVAMKIFAFLTLSEILTLSLGLAGLVAGIVTVVVYHRQLKAMRGALVQQQFSLEQQQAALENQLLMQRRELYSSMTTTLTADEVSAMLLHVADHLDVEVYKTRYAGSERRIRSYFLMKRKYLYLVLSTSFKTKFDDPAGMARKIWLDDLISYREFQDVHACQAHYYPLFAKLVDERMAAKQIHHLRWADSSP
jgi:hypothetical protein